VAALPHIAADTRFITNAGRVQHHDALQPAIAATLATRTADEWVDLLREAGVPCGAVRSVGDALTDPQTIARQMVEHVIHPTIGPLPVLGVPVKLSATPGTVRSAPPRLGEHTRQVLQQDLGYDDARIDAIAKSGAIRLLEP
jgi:crotonobetainyl-CoA:carnitine CoA-transferase CaiB-like acyl-CoA transferase